MILQMAWTNNDSGWNHQPADQNAQLCFTFKKKIWLLLQDHQMIISPQWIWFFAKDKTCYYVSFLIDQEANPRQQAQQAPRSCLREKQVERLEACTKSTLSRYGHRSFRNLFTQSTCNNKTNPEISADQQLQVLETSLRSLFSLSFSWRIWW
jgi:hypothetical protein